LFIAGGLEAKAAVVSTNEAGMDAIYSQGSFGSNDVDIRFNSIMVVNNAALTSIDSLGELNALFGIADGSLNVFMFFVDEINYCDGPGMNIIGCGEIGGNAIAVDSDYAETGTFSAVLNAHELGHALGLLHPTGLGPCFPSNNNLMCGSINGDTTLTAGQVSTILASPFVQDDNGQLFVQITPVLITPIPPAGILFLSGILGLAWMRRRNRAADAEQPEAT
jgi:hypothetical protein